MKVSFNGSPAPTVGVELELQILDPETKNLVSGASRILDRVGDDPHVKPELIQSAIEVNTAVCRNVAEVRRDLGGRVGALLSTCDELGYELACAGTHPFAKWADQATTDKERYHVLVDRCQWPARRLLIFGLHVHVGVATGEKAIAILNSLTTFLPHLLALSASSPFFADADTGLASCRVKIFESLPTAGLPYRLKNWAEFLRFMTTLANAKAITTVREIWWDIRPHPNFGTVEVRICDGLPTLDEVMALTALVQALVVWLDERYDAGEALPVQRFWLVRENKWRAARWSTDAEMIVDEDGNLQRLSESIEALRETLEPVAHRLGSVPELLRVTDILRQGPSHVRQRRVHAETGTYRGVMAALVREFRENVPVVV